MDVVRLSWPTEAARRTVLRTRGVPRLLIVDDDAEPPGDLDVLEDWVRAATNSMDVEARAATLSLRSDRTPPPPFFDDDGLLRYGRQLVLLSPLSKPVWPRCSSSGWDGSSRRRRSRRQDGRRARRRPTPSPSPCAAYATG